MWLEVILLLHVVLTQQVPGSFVNVEAGNFGVWAVNAGSRVFWRDMRQKRWVLVPGRLKQISVGGNQVWGVSKEYAIFMTTSRRGLWKRVAGALKHVSVSNTNNVWGVNRGGLIYRRVGNGWQRISGGLKQISVGEAGVWGVNDANDLYYRQGTYGDRNTAGSDWVKLIGKFKWISSGKRVIGVNSKNEILERVGRSAQFPIGTCWKKISGLRLGQVDVGIHRNWGVANVYRNGVYRDGPIYVFN